MDSGVQVELDEDGEPLVSFNSELVRVLRYLDNTVRSDISFPVGL